MDAAALPPMVRLDWVDSFNVGSGWHDEDDVSGKEPALVSSVGFVVNEDGGYIRLALSLYDAGDGRQVSGVTIIPKCSVTRRETLTS